MIVQQFSKFFFGLPNSLQQLRSRSALFRVRLVKVFKPSQKDYHFTHYFAQSVDPNAHDWIKQLNGRLISGQTDKLGSSFLQTDRQKTCIRLIMVLIPHRLLVFGSSEEQKFPDAHEATSSWVSLTRPVSWGKEPRSYSPWGLKLVCSSSNLPV